MAEMVRVPRKRGLPAIHKILKTLCRLLVTYEVVIKAILPTEQHVYVDALKQACDDFVLNVDNPDAGTIV